jgi:hypothetical protein
MQFNMAGKRMVLDRGRYKAYGHTGSMSSQKASKAEKLMVDQAKENEKAQERRVLSTTQFVPPVHH